VTTGVGSTEPERSGGAGFAGAGASTAWLDVCRACVADVRGVLDDLPTRTEREPVVGAGLGGDDTTAIDKAAEDAILARLQALDDVTIVSEEVGRLGDGTTVVVVDPIDGSLNAKRGIPFFAVSIAVADGMHMGDVRFGYVYDFGSGEEWLARRGGGATLNGARLTVQPKEAIEILAFEATESSLIARDAPRVADLAYRLRVMGSLALSLCHLASGRLDAVCSLKPARSVDIAAAQLLVRESGLAIALFDDPRPFEEAELDLEGRSRVAAAGTPELCQKLANALSA
jgi:myo-inositol-1(or 4)-monophosphatase